MLPPLPIFLLAAAAAASPRPPLPEASPGREGISAPRLERLHAFMRREIEDGDYLGAVTLVARHGRIVDWQAYGHSDFPRRLPVRRDSIFRIYSMTKPLTTVAVLMLLEEGRLNLNDPVDRFLPGFSAMQVCVGGTADRPELRPAVRPITLHHLLTHTAGFATAETDGAAVREIYGRYDLHHCPDFATYCDRLARLPLAADPGTRFSYDGVNLEVLCRVVEVVSGESFDAFLTRRLLKPLGMTDTGFSVPPDQRSRIVDLAAAGPDGRLAPSPAWTATHPGERLNAYPSGAGGLYSTAGDYVRFCQMLLNGGHFDGVTYLGRKTVELMMTNQLTLLPGPSAEFRPGEGFGLGGSVRVDVPLHGTLGSVGQFGWSGAASTYFTIDPREQLVALLLLQENPARHKIQDTFYNLVYQSLQ